MVATLQVVVTLPSTSSVACALLVLASIGAWTSPSYAQVNTETFRSQLSKDPAFLSIEAALATRTGNIAGSTFSGGLFAGFATGRHLAFTRNQGDYGEANGATIISRAFTHARYNFFVVPALALEAFGQLQSDKFLRLSLRSVAGVGPRWNIVREVDFEVFVASTYLLENEVLEAVEGDGRHEDLYHRSSSYAGLGYRLDERAQVSSITYFQPRFDRPHDFRLLHETAIVLGITQHLSAKIGVTFRYDNEPPFNVKNHDLEVKNSLMVKF